MKFSHEAYQEIANRIAPEALEFFLEKSKDYEDAFAFLGVKGQFSDINRKFQKLKLAVWDGKELEGEQPDEIVRDLIGHCFLTLWLMEQEAKDDGPPIFASAGPIEGGAIMFSEEPGLAPMRCRGTVVEAYDTEDARPLSDAPCDECGWLAGNGHHMSCTKHKESRA